VQFSPDMTYRYNVFSGTLNHAQSINQSIYLYKFQVAMIKMGSYFAANLVVHSGLDTGLCVI